MKMFKASYLLTLISITAVECERQTVSVQTKIGTINGFVEEATFQDKAAKVQKFLGIPFAEPPVGDLRFKKPVPKSPLEGPLDAFRHRSACAQINIGVLRSKKLKYEEDCLYLNIYVPEQQGGKKELLPVMVWIYGGAFSLGYADMYIGDNIALHGDVIVVTLNYRLSVWGFLSTKDKHSPGNYALWDQHLAIKWVHDNIAAFGGDADRVTIFGESAGSASVMFQALYPGNKGLFQRAIGLSGSVGNFWSSNENNDVYVKKLGTLAGCETDKSEDLVGCLRAVPTEQLEEIVSNFTLGFVTIPFPFEPVVDNDFVTTDPKQTFQKTTNLPDDVRDFFSSLDILTGVTTAEGSMGINPLMGIFDPENFLPNREYFKNTLVPNLVNACLDRDSGIVKDAIAAEYTPWESPEDPLKIREEVVAMWGDVAFNAELHKTLVTHAEVSPRQNTYMYVFDVKLDYVPRFLSPVSWITKPIHSEDVPFTFGFKNPDGLEDEYHVSPSASEERVAADFITLFSNFAKTGNPNSPRDLEFDWLPYTRKHQHYLHITRDMTSSNVKQRWNAKRINFWTNLVPKIIKTSMSGGTKYSKDLNTNTCDGENKCSP